MADQDMEFHEEQARSWQKSVAREFKETTQLLKTINETIEKADPEHSDDDFLKLINEVNTNVTAQWTKLEAVFSDCNNKVDQMFRNIHNWVTENVDRAKTLNQRVGN